MRRRLCADLDLLIPSVEKHVDARQYSSMVNRTEKDAFASSMQWIRFWHVIMVKGEVDT